MSIIITKTAAQQKYIEKRIERAIDAMIDIQDKGVGNDEVQRVLDILNTITVSFH